MKNVIFKGMGRVRDGLLPVIPVHVPAGTGKIPVSVY